MENDVKKCNKVNLVAMTGKDSPRWSPMTEVGYIKACKDMDYDATAITGITLYSLIPAWKAAKKQGIKFIVGATVFVCNDPLSQKSPYQTLRIYAKDDAGYKALCRILTESQKHFIHRNDRDIPTVSLDTVKKYCGEGATGYGHVVILSGGANGVIQGVMLEDDSSKEIFDEKYSKYQSCKALLGFMAEVEKSLSEASEEKTKWESVSKKDLSVKQKYLDAEMKRLKAMDNPPEKEVEKILRAMDALSKEKEEFAGSKEELKKATAKVKKFQKQKEDLETQCREVTGNMDIDNIEALTEFTNKMGEELKKLQDAMSGEVTPESRMLDRMSDYADMFGKDNFFVEVQNHGTEKEKQYNSFVCETAKALGLSIVATNNAYRLKKEDSDLWSTVNYKETKLWETPPEEEYLKDDDELLKALTESIGEELAKEAMDNRGKIADMCNVSFDNPERHFPAYACEELNDGIEQELLEILA